MTGQCYRTRRVGCAFTVCAENAPCTGTHGDKETAVSVKPGFRVDLSDAAEKLLASMSIGEQQWRRL